jgi:hemolysin activation/secretion protein
MRKNISFFFLSFLAAAGIGALLSADSRAGVVERQLEKEYEQDPLETRKEIPTMQMEMPKERLQLPKATRVFIKRLEIRGNNSIQTKEICSWVTCELNRELSIDEIYNICHLIDEGYANKGYFLARAYPPPQKIIEGILIIEILEGNV